MNILDFLILAFILIGALVGLYRGFFKELAGTLGLLLAAIVANWMMPVSDNMLAVFTDPETVGSEARVGTAIIVWIIVFVIVMLVMNLLAGLVEKLVSTIHLGCYSRLCGAVFGALKVVCICAFLISFLEILCAHVEGLSIQSLIDGSQLLPKLHQVVDLVMPSFCKYILNPAIAVLQN